MHSSPFTVAGMSSSTSSHHAPNLNTWGSTSTAGSLTTPFSDSLSQSRSHYQTGYLMSASQNTNVPQGSQRIDEVPVVPTKAKMNHGLSRGPNSDFGMDSMFQSTRQRQNLADEDAPPMFSVNDIPNEVNPNMSTTHFQPRKSTVENSPHPRRHARAPSTSHTAQPLYIIVFGYPADKYSVTAEYFKSLGDSTEPDQNMEITNCFRIGYTNPADAMRAVRKNGEVLGGNWMIGAKWADAAQAEALLGLQVTRNNISAAIPDTPLPGNSMMVDEPPSSTVSNSNAPSVGTPIKLAPSTAAFRKAGSSSKPGTPQVQRGWPTGAFPGASTSGQETAISTSNTPSKGALGQISDLIFGW